MPGQIKPARAKRRVQVGLIIVLVVVGLLVLNWFRSSPSNDDKDRIDPVVTRALAAHVARGTRLSVTLRSGPRILQIGHATVTYQGLTPTTCVYVGVIDPKTGAEDPKTNYPNQTCIEGLKYP